MIRSLVRLSPIPVLVLAVAGCGARSAAMPETAQIMPASTSAYQAGSSRRRSVLPKRLVDLEDGVDRLEPKMQAVNYQSLREELQKLKTGAALSAVDRVGQKIELAEMRTRTADPTAAQRREFSRRAGRIGLSHLQQDDPQRAVRWQQIAAGFDEQSPWTGRLQGQVQTWFRQRLYNSLSGRRWEESRRLLDRWRLALHDDPALSRALRDYSQARKDNVIFLLRTRGPDRALKELHQESLRYPGQPEWASARIEIAEHVQNQFQVALGRQSLPRSRAELSRQTRLASAFDMESAWSLKGNQQKIDDLEAALYPNLIDRDYGQLRYSLFRGTLQISPVSEKEDGIVSLGRLPMMDVHYLPRGKINWGAGMIMGDTLVQHEDFSISMLAIGFSLLKRGRSWVSWFAIGFDAYDAEESDNLDESLSGLMFQAGVEYGFHRRWTVMATGRWGQSSDFPYQQLYAGLNYYINNHLGIGVGVTQVEFEARERDVKFEFTNILAPVLNVMF